MNYKYPLFFILTLLSGKLDSTPTVTVELPALLGNRLFAFCIGKIVAQGLGYRLNCIPIPGFPNTFQYVNNHPLPQYHTQLIHVTHDIDINGLTTNKDLRNIHLRGYFQRYQYLKPYTEKIKNDWLLYDKNQYPINEKDIVIHIRTNHPSIYIPFEYYEKALAATTFEKVYICLDEPYDPILEKFKKYNPIIRNSHSLSQLMNAGVPWPEISRINLDDFFFIASFKKIIISHSTYAWWAAFLSEATEIYAPYNDDISRQVYGKVEEERYHYITTSIGKKINNSSIEEDYLT